MAEKALLSATDADERLQNLFKLKKKALQRDPRSIWQHFQGVKVADGSGFRVKFKCTLCNKTISTQNPVGTMSRHLRSSNCTTEGQKIMREMDEKKLKRRRTDIEEEAEEFVLSNEEEEILKEMSGVTGTSLTKRSKQSTLTGEAGIVAKLPEATKQRFIQYFCRWVITNSTLSFRCIEAPILKNAFNCIGLKPIDRKKLAGEILDSEYKRVLDMRKEQVDKSNMYQLTGDSWKSHYAKGGFKILASTITFPEGGAMVSGR